MKSLEILEHIKNAPEFMGGDERYKNSINSPIKYIEDIMTIKKDLEVLEIFKKLWFCKTDFKDRKEYFIQIHSGTKHYNKIKQWLEENRK